MELNKQQRQILLLMILGINLVSTILHYTDNFLFFSQYPAPTWMTPASVYIAWLLLTPFGFIGYFLYKRDVFLAAYVCLGIYALTGAASPGHYLFPAAENFSLKMHLFIWFDAIAGLLLLGFTIWSGLFLREWQRSVSSFR
ncbi:hypothetical protein K9N68_25085 [Kovacikia minuta CCNUW1]|uniref:hypothetical protein n=1 Tax=Kovacikia minuta TaxID=2931930 RepID=UPI001CCCEE79|nr:hypothetical protein [Kovacikia minuta]UBF24901.1 hypothetical protein K9N68_25085 [Kovacikia minuta CCNUW1]